MYSGSYPSLTKEKDHILSIIYKQDNIKPVLIDDFKAEVFEPKVDYQ